MKPLLKKTLTLILVFGINQIINAQTTITLQPNADLGKDATIIDKDPDLTNGTSEDFIANAWTNIDNLLQRSLIDFDFSSIPSNSTILNATLSLYSNPTSSNTQLHSSLSGSNACWLERITSIWYEDSVTWNNQPTTTIQNRVTIPQSSYATEDYPNIDVTMLIQDIIDNSSNSFGLMIKLQTEQKYRSMVFASSDHSDSTLHPKLVITYTPPNGIKKVGYQSEVISIYPNPSQGLVNIKIEDILSESIMLEIINMYGQVLLQKEFINCNPPIYKTFDLSDYSKGLYFVKYKTQNLITTEKLIIY